MNRTKLILIAATLSMIGVSGCISVSTYTKLTHPEVEVLDEKLGIFVFEEVTPVSNCKNCHQERGNEYAYYSTVVDARKSGGKTSIDKIELIKSHEPTDATFSGYDNYSDSDFGYYYYYPWWYDNYVVSSGIYGSVPDKNSNESGNEKRTRSSYRRGSGRLRLSDFSTPIYQSSTPANSSGSGSSSSAIVVPNSGGTTNNSGNSSSENSGNNRRGESSSTNTDSGNTNSGNSDRGNSSNDNSNRRTSGRSR